MHSAKNELKKRVGLDKMVKARTKMHFLHRFSYYYDTFSYGIPVAHNHLTMPYVIQLYKVI